MTKDEVALFRYNFKRLLKLKNWDLDDCAEHSGISKAALKQYSAGYREPKPEFREILAKTFRVDTSEFYRTEEDLKQATLLKESKKIVAEKNQRRMDAIAWELNLDMEDPKDKEFLRSVLPILPELKQIPVDIIGLLTKQNEVYFNSLRRILLGLEEKKQATKKKTGT